MKKNKIRLNESQLQQIIKESVKEVLQEEYDCPKDGIKIAYGLPIVNNMAITVLKNNVICITSVEDACEMIENRLLLRDKTSNCTQAFNTFEEAKHYCMCANKILGKEVFSPRAIDVWPMGGFTNRPNLFGHKVTGSEGEPVDKDYKLTTRQRRLKNLDDLRSRYGADIESGQERFRGA